MVLKIAGSTHKFNNKKFEKQLVQENKFISDLFGCLPIPTSAIPNETEVTEHDDTRNNYKLLSIPNGTTRAHSLDELQNRLQTIQSKKKLNYKEKLQKKGLKNRLKKKSKKEERSLKQKLMRTDQSITVPKIKLEENAKVDKVKKPIFNSEGKIVFSKFDFSGIGTKHDKKSEKDPKKILKILEKQKEKINELKAKGDSEKLTEVKEKYAWKNALAKAEGQKVKDDPILLKKSIKKREQQRKVSQKKWTAREEGLKKAQEERQRKRNDNIAKQKKEKKTSKMKKAVKRGKIIPGF